MTIDARDLANIAADLVRLADDMDKDAVLPAITAEGRVSRACTLADDRNEAAGALSRFAKVAAPWDAIPAAARAGQIEGGYVTSEQVRAWAAEYRALDLAGA